MTTINDISDLARILQERPEWLSTIRGLVLTEEVLRLPETMASLTKTVDELARQTAEQFRIVNERLGRLEVDVGGLKADVGELKSDMVEVKADVRELKSDMVEVKADVRELKSDMVEVKADVRELKSDMVEVKADVGELKSDMVEVKADVGELKSDMVEVKADVRELKSDMVEVKADVGELKTEQRRTNRRLDRVESQLGAVRGEVFEITAARKIVPNVIREMGLYHCDTIVAPGTHLGQDRINEIRQAELAGTVERSSDQQVGLADLILYGRRSSDNQPIWVVIEASARIDEHDITRARHRADILAAVYRENSAAVVVGESIDDRDQARATDAGVSVITVRPRYRPTEGDD